MVKCKKNIERIYDPTCENGVWRIKYNDELYSFYKDLDIVRVINVAKIRWLGHLFSQNGGKLTLQKDNLLAA
jgi:hypothetical protein